MHYVQRQLMGMRKMGKSYPKLIRRWINYFPRAISSPLSEFSATALKTCSNRGLVRSIEDHNKGIYNYFRSDDGLNCHRSVAILVNPAVGSVIADWWKHN
jgi:hypothetical protein